MTAEQEVCNGALSEVAAIDDKSEFKARSFQDLAKPELNGIGNHDQTDDPEDSYVLVNDVGDLSADVKDMAAVDGSPQRESSARVELLGIELDASNGNQEGEDAGKHGNAESGDRSLSLVNGGPDVQSIPIVDGGGDQDTVEEDNKCLEELSDQNGKADGVDGEVDRLFTEGGIGNPASTGEIPLVANGVLAGEEGSVQDEDEIGDELAISKPECSAESEIKKAEGSNGNIERSEEVEATRFEDQNGEIRVVAEAEPDTVEDQLISEASPGVGENQESKVPNLESEEEDEPKSSLSLFDKQETVEDVAESALGKEAMQDHKCDIDPENDVHHGLDKGNVAESNTDCNVKMAGEEVLEGNDEGIFSVSHVKGSTYPEEEPVSSLSEVEEEHKSLLAPVDKQETVEDVASSASSAESTLGNEVMQDQKCDIDPENNVQHGLDNNKVVESNANSNVRMASDQVFKGKDEGIFSVSLVEGSIYPEEEPKSSLSEEEEEPKSSLSPFDKQETVEDVAESAVGKEAMADPEYAIPDRLVEDKVVEGDSGCNVRMAGVQVLEGKNEGIFSVSHVQSSMMYPEDTVISQDSHGAGPKISVSEREAKASEPTQKISPSSAQVHSSANEIQISDTETFEVMSLPVDGSESESLENEPIHLDSLESSTINGACSGADLIVVSDEKEPISQGSELSADFEDDRNPSEANNSSAVNHEAMTSEIDATSELEVWDSFVSDKGVSNSILESKDFKDMGGSAIGSDDETLLLTKNGDTGNSRSVDVSMASPESSSEKVTEKDVSGVAVTKPFNFFVRIPRYSDEKLQEQIRMAELEVNEKTKLRDSIQAQIQEKRAKNQNNGIDYEYAKGEDRNLKKLLKEKRMEIDSLQSVINKAKNATSIEDLNSRIKTIEHMIQHETLTLKEEKQLIHEIKQLKQLREQLSSSKCSDNEIQQALGQREQAEERLKIVRQELGNLKDTASKAQTACDEAESKYNIEHKKVKELQAQFRAANDVRQVAYAKFLHLSKELSQKRKNFFKIKNDSAAATNSASFTDDRRTVHHHYVNEVENFMELWNGNDEFRSEYVRLNTRSTLRRFGTLDGRSLGPGERPPIIPSYVRERNDKLVSVPANADSISQAMELKPETKIENVSSDNHSSKKETESKEKPATTKEPAKSKQLNSLATVSGLEENVEVQEEPMKTKEELELIRIAEEVRREEAEAKLKEQRRLEEIVKAKEARERKQRRDEKAQKREELKARKEAEQKEKEREKKSRKKERKNAVTTSTSASTDLQDDASSITCVEISKEEASTQMNDVSTKKPKTSRVMVSKQNKTRSVPPPFLRNRNRRKWQQWMLISLITFVVLVLFWLGNMGVFSSVKSKLQGSGF